MKKLIILVAIIVIIGGGIFWFFNRGPVIYNDGIYTASSDGAFGEIKVTLTIEEGRITRCDMELRDKQGNIKDKNYGKSGTVADFRLAQRALMGVDKYPTELVRTQDAYEIDAVSGATSSLRSFQRAVKLALRQARQ